MTRSTRLRPYLFLLALLAAGACDPELHSRVGADPSTLADPDSVICGPVEAVSAQHVFSDSEPHTLRLPTGDALVAGQDVDVGADGAPVRLQQPGRDHPQRPRVWANHVNPAGEPTTQPLPHDLRIEISLRGCERVTDDVRIVEMRTGRRLTGGVERSAEAGGMVVYGIIEDEDRFGTLDADHDVVPGGALDPDADEAHGGRAGAMHGGFIVVAN